MSEKKSAPKEKPPEKKRGESCQVRIYAEILVALKKMPAVAECGLTYAVNKILADRLKLPEPDKPVERKAAGGKNKQIRPRAARNKMNRKQTKQQEEL